MYKRRERGGRPKTVQHVDICSRAGSARSTKTAPPTVVVLPPVAPPSPIFRPSLTPLRLLCHPFRTHSVPHFSFSSAPPTIVPSLADDKIYTPPSSSSLPPPATIGTTAGPFYRLFYALEAAASALYLPISGSSPCHTFTSAPKKLYTKSTRRSRTPPEPAAREISSHFFTHGASPPPLRARHLFVALESGIGRYCLRSLSSSTLSQHFHLLY